MGRQTRTQLRMAAWCSQSDARFCDKNPTDPKGNSDSLAWKDADSFTDVVVEPTHIAE